MSRADGHDFQEINTKWRMCEHLPTIAISQPLEKAGIVLELPVGGSAVKDII